jgi:hypothetical protein
MPIVINELVFKGTIADPLPRDNERPSAPAQSAIDPEMLVQICVERVLEALKREKER